MTAPPVTAPAAVAQPQVTGFDQKSSKELPEQRGPQTRVFQNPDGTYTTQYFNEQVNFRRADGSWQEIDTTLKPRTAGGAVGRSVTTSATGWTVTSGESASAFGAYADADPLVSLDLGEGRSVAFGIQGAAHVPGQADGSNVTYPAARPSTDVTFVAGSTSVKELLILKNASAPREWVFPLHLQGLTAAIDGTGSVVFTDSDGVQRGRVPAGWMEDSQLTPDANEGAISGGVTYQLVEVAGAQALKVVLDAKWLDEPTRVYPVKVDPSVTGVSATSGTYVESPYNQNFSGDTVLKAGTYDGGSHQAAAFLQFAGVESSLKNAWVLGANLSLYNTWSQSCAARPVTVHPITSAWSESSTTKYPGPATGAALSSKSFAHGWRPEGTTTWSCAPAWETMNLGAAGRQLVDDWTHGRKKNYGLAVKASTSDSKGWKQFGSDDYPNGKPRLDVTWTKYGATYAVGAWVTPVTATAEGVMKVTVTNRGQQTWPRNGTYKLRYDLYDKDGKYYSNSATNITWTPMPQDVPPGASVTLDAKIHALPSAQYTLVWTMDDYGTSLFTNAGVPGLAIGFAAINIPPQLTAEAPASGVVLNSLTPTLWTSGKDTDHSPSAALQYTFEVCEVAGNDARKNCRSSARTAEQQWAVTSGWLSWSKQYAWYSYAFDGAATSVRPGPSFFTTQVPQPGVTNHLGGADGGREFGARAGNYSTAATDAAVATVGPELSVTRTYNSLDPRADNAFGAGWSTRWDMHAVAESSGNVVVTFADGTQVRFGRNADGSYAAPSGGVTTLKSVTAGGWTLRDASASLYTFDATGLLTNLTDGSGRQQKLIYTGGKLTQAMDLTSGRSLSFVWNGSHVASATTSAIGPTSAGLAWSYTYAGDRLVKVCPPASATVCTVYDYTDGSQYRSGVLDQNPVSYWRLGESEGESAASEAPSRTGINNASYRDVTFGADGALAGTDNHAATFDGTDSYVALPDDSLRASTFLSVELWFKTAKSGVILSQANERKEDVDVTGSHTTPVLYVGSDGKLRGRYYIPGGDFLPITSSAAVTDNAWHHIVLSGAGTTQALFLDGAQVGTRTGTISHLDQRYTYLGLGWTAVPWAGIDKTDPLGHFSGQIDEVSVYDHPLDLSTVADHYAARQTVGKLTKATLPSGRVHAAVDYDRDTERVTSVTDENGGKWKVSAPTYSAGSAAYADAVRGSAPSAFWRLGDRRGAVAQSDLPAGVDGAYGDGVSLGTAGAFADGDDTAAGFDGTTSYARLEDGSLGGTQLSAELWFRTDRPGMLLTESNADLEDGASPTHSTPLMYVGSDGKLHGRFYSEPTSWIPPVSKSTVTDNQWHHAVLVGAGSTSSLYLDGALVGKVSDGPIMHLDQNRIYLGLGVANTRWPATNMADAAGHFSGAIDEVAFYDKALDAQTVLAHQRARSGQVAGDGAQYRGSVVGDAPAGYWHLDETSGTSAASELAANAGTGTYANATLATDGVFGPGDGTAVQFAGNGYTELPGALMHASKDLAVELWFKTAKPGVLVGDQSLPLAGAAAPGGSYVPLLYVGSDNKLHGKFNASYATIPTSLASASTVTDDQWHHAVISASGTVQTLYLDGVAAGTFTGAVDHETHSRVYLGAGFAKNWPNAPADISYFTGQIDEASVYQHPLTADQVARHYAARDESSVSALASTITVTDPQNHTTTSSYDALRGQRVLSTTAADGGITTYAYDNGGFLHTVTDPNGHSAVTGHDAQGNTVSSTTCRDSNSCWTSYFSYSYNAADPLDPLNGKLLTSRDGRSSGPSDDRYRTTNTYDTAGLQLSTVKADNRTALRTYTYATEAAVGGGIVPKGLVETETTAGGATTNYKYFASGDVASITTPSGLVTAFQYDGLGRKTSETQVSDAQPAGVKTSYGYDTMSHVVTEAGPGVRNELTDVTHTAVVTRDFDPDGRLVSESTEDTTGGDTKRTVAHTYNNLGLNDSSTDAEGNKTQYTHDGLGRVTAQTDPAGNTTTYDYTPLGQLAASTLKDWTGDPSGQTRDLVLESRAYDPGGRLASVTDAMGATTAYTYFDDGRTATVTAKAVTQADGSKHDVVRESDTYDGAGNLVRKDAAGATTTFAVDATGRVSKSVFDPNGLNRTATYGYDDDDHVTQQTQSVDGGTGKVTTTLLYNTAGNLTDETVTDGSESRITEHFYDQRGLITTTITPGGSIVGSDAPGFSTSYRYDALGRTVETTAPRVQIESDGSAATTARPVTLSGYNSFGEVTETRDERGNVSRATVDRLGRVVSQTLPDYTPPGSATSIKATAKTSYDVLGHLATTTDPLNRVTQYAFDQLGHPVAQSLPKPSEEIGLLPGAITEPAARASWSPTGLQLSSTDPVGARTEATYDELGRKLTATTVERYPTVQNLTSTYTWDDADHQTSSTTPSGARTAAVYNRAGEVVSVTDPMNRTTRTDYDGLGRVIKATQPLGEYTTTSYNSIGQPLDVSDYAANGTKLRTTTSTYSRNGDVSSVVSATGSTTNFVFDGLGRMTKQTEKVTDAASITTTFGYDASGNRTRLTDGRGNSTYSTYNSWGLAESTIEPATAAHSALSDRTWTTAYDAVGKAVTVTAPGNVVRAKTYDILGRLTKESGTGTASPTADRTLGYDLLGRLTSVGEVVPFAPSTANTYTYNDRGQLLSANGPGGASNYVYDRDGNMASRNDAAGTSTFTYNGASQLVTAADPITGTTVAYGYDGDGRASSEQYGVAGGTRTYGYDNLGRLASDTVKAPSGTAITSAVYGYDLDDHLTSKATTGSAGAGNNGYVYDKAGRLVSWTNGSTTTNYEWDASGNRTKAGSGTATYDERNRLTSDSTSTYGYTARGTLNTTTTSGTTRTSRFDAFDRLTQDGTTDITYDGLDRVTKRGTTAFTYDGGSNNLVTDGTSTISRRPDGGLLATTTGTTKQLAVTDQHTDVTAGLTADGSAATSSASYDPFGSKLASSGTTPALGFQSGWTDPDTGKVNMAARWYQPGTGTFASRDDWDLPPSPSIQANRYTYGNGGPLNGTDPTGHCFWDACVGETWLTVAAGAALIGTCAKYCGQLSSSLSDAWDQMSSWGANSSSSTSTTTTTTDVTHGGVDYACWEFFRCGNRSSNNDNSRGNKKDRGKDKSRNDDRGDGGGKSDGDGNVRTTPRRPPIDQNPNNGPRPGPAPTLRPPKPDWNPRKPTPEDILRLAKMVYGAKQLIDMFSGDDEAYAPGSDGVRLQDLVDMFPGEDVDPDLGFGQSGADPTATRTRNACSRDLPSTDPAFYYAPMTRFGPGADECRATGAVATINTFDLRPWRLDPKWKPAGYDRLPPGNRAALHLIGNQMGGARDTLRNFVAGYQNPANSPHMRELENDITAAVRGGQNVRLGVLPVYGGSDPAIPSEIKMYAVGDGGYHLDCTVYNRPSGGYSCPVRSSGGRLSIP
ncbi:LamG-like jellyroll fold domain-containing protein [Streptomyces fildesensis]|uniref:LamG-like jellyroll fold domain-containing protein n=1 Tax=Streptomyces fildesensis TaxID=375757 RepID=A0ABW8CHE1_9ACTN